VLGIVRCELGAALPEVAECAGPDAWVSRCGLVVLGGRRRAVGGGSAGSLGFRGRRMLRWFVDDRSVDTGSVVAPMMTLVVAPVVAWRCMVKDR